jgi:hypothetical protein
MKTRSIVLIGLAAAVPAALAVLIFSHAPARDTGRLAKPQTAADAVTRVILPRQAGTAPPVSVAENPQTATRTNENSARPVSNVASKEPLKDPVAREALSLVGLDPEAEAYWFEAINDMSLPPNERQDLIEDLNEEGLPDPKHPTIDDLPLIFSRLELIEAIGPDAADEINADAFNEAYKDLLNLAEVATGGGEPVK